MRLRRHESMRNRHTRIAGIGQLLLFYFILTLEAVAVQSSCGDEPQLKAAGGNSVARQIRLYWGVHSATFSPDGNLIVTAGDGPAQIWHARSGRAIRQVGLANGTIGCIAFAQDGKTIAIASSHPEISFLKGEESFVFLHIPFHSRLTVWDVETGELIREFEGEKGLISVHIADPVDSSRTEEVRTFDGQRGGVESIAFSQDGTSLLSGSRGEVSMLAPGYAELKIWDVSTGKAKVKLDPIAGSFRCAGFSRNGQLVTALIPPGEWRYIDIISSNALTGAQESRRTLDQRVVALGGPEVFLSPSAEVVAVIKNNEIKLAKVATGKFYRILRGSPKSLSSAAFSPDGKRIAANCYDGPILVWELSEENEVPLEISTADDAVRSVGFSPDGQTIVACEKQHLRFWNAESGKAVLDDEGQVLLIPRSLDVTRQPILDTSGKPM